VTVVLGDQNQDRSAAIEGETLAPLGWLVGFNPRLVLAGETLAPTGALTSHYAHPVSPWDLDLTGPYAPPVGTADLNLGGAGSLNRAVVVAGETLAPTGRLVARKEPTAVFSGETRAPTGSIQAIKIVGFALAGETLAPTGRLQSHYDPNLLSAVQATTAAVWRDGDLPTLGLVDRFQDSTAFQAEGLDRWRDAEALPDGTLAGWRDAAALQAVGRETWREADLQERSFVSLWRDSPRLDATGADRWQEADEPPTLPIVSRFRVRSPLLAHDGIPVWRHGANLTHHVRDGMRDGWRLLAVEIEVWQPAGTPGNAPNPGPPLPSPPAPWPWGTDLKIRCPLPGTTLRIGRSPCILVAEREIPIRRSYMTTNTVSLVRWPDLTPLPVTAMTIETDFDSWCWSLTATLAGPAAWALVQPNPLACEVQATINGQVWRFLLDVPSTNRSFNSDRVTLKGRSRSAWLHDPYTPASHRSEVDARDMTQLAVAALANTGWTLDWRLPDWTVPAGRYISWNTPIGALIRLVNTTDDGLYTDPTLQLITMIKRWPVASWLVDGETADLAVPEAAILSLTQSPVYSPPYNGVYVSGISHGALALVKIAGTDGALQPAEPITDELLCDEAGVAARQRGLNALSDSGAGWEMDAETLFAPDASPAFPLVPPGKIVSIAGMKGVSRSCKISAQRAGDALSVRQSIGLERREVEEV
jgi:hypothetical protein